MEILDSRGEGGMRKGRKEVERERKGKVSGKFIWDN